MRILKIIAVSLSVLLAVALVGLFGFYKWALLPLDLQPYAAAFNKGDKVDAGDVAVTYLGVSTLYITDGDTHLMVDGFFSRPPAWKLGVGRIDPDEEAIDWALAKAGITQVDAIFPVHSHYDHAMDTAVVAQKFGADMLGGLSTMNIGRGAGVPENKLVQVEEGKPYRYGRFTVTFIESEHAPLPSNSGIDGEITEPLEPPQPYSAWKMGEAWSILISHHARDGVKTMLVQGSAGFRPDNLQGRTADAVFLGVGGLGSLTTDYQNAYWAEFVEKPGAAKVYPTHWDDFTQPLTQPLQGQKAEIFGVKASLDWVMQKRAAPNGPRVELLQSFVTVTPFK